MKQHILDTIRNIDWSDTKRSDDADNAYDVLAYGGYDISEVNRPKMIPSLDGAYIKSVQEFSDWENVDLCDLKEIYMDLQMAGNFDFPRSETEAGRKLNALVFFDWTNLKRIPLRYVSMLLLNTDPEFVIDEVEVTDDEIVRYLGNYEGWEKLDEWIFNEIYNVTQNSDEWN